MPEEKKMAIDNEDTSPAKSKTSSPARTSSALVHMTMLDGSVSNIYIDVSILQSSIAVNDIVHTFNRTFAFD